MTRTRSFRNHLLALPILIAGSASVVGCIDPAPSASSESAASTVAPTVITDRAALAGLALDTVRYQQTADGVTVVPAASWTQSAPGVWTRSANGATTTLTVSTTEPAPNALEDCDFLELFGRSSPTTGFSGASALFQIHCRKGCMAFTIAIAICTDKGCVSQSKSDVACPDITFGLAAPGSPGARCTIDATVAPPGVAFNSTVTCG